MKKITIKGMLLLLLASPLSAVDIYKDETSAIDLSGRIVVMGSNKNSVNDSYDLLKFQNDSRLGIKGTHIINDSFSVEGYTEWGFDALASSKEKGNFLYNRYGYISLDAKNLGKFSFGKTLSPVNDMLFANTVDKLYIGTNDAGATAFYLDEGSDYGLSKIRNAVTYENQFGGFKIGVQFQGEGDLESYYDEVNDAARLERKYGVGVAAKYEHNGFEVNAGYVRVDLKNKTSSDIKDSELNSNMYLGSVGYNNEKVELGLAGGYYENYQLIGAKYLGSAIYVAYHLNKVMPYISYDLVYGIDSNKDNKENNAVSKDSSVDRSNITFGLFYEVSSKLYFAVEYAYDLRTDSQIKESMLAKEKSKDLTLYLRYNI